MGSKKPVREPDMHHYAPNRSNLKHTTCTLCIYTAKKLLILKLGPNFSICVATLVSVRL